MASALLRDLAYRVETTERERATHALAEDLAALMAEAHVLWERVAVLVCDFPPASPAPTGPGEADDVLEPTTHL